MDWRECADFLRIYWNVADIAGIGGLLTKELRMNVLGSGEKIIRAYAYTNNLLLAAVKDAVRLPNSRMYAKYFALKDVGSENAHLEYRFIRSI